MPIVDAHPPGTFCWPELATTDQDGARAFYTALFGWTANESPLEDGATYTQLMLDGRAAAALYRMRERDHPPGTPPYWGAYIAVTSADDAAARVAASGGRVLAGAFDVMDHGRMAVCADAVGAMFCLWQPKAHFGVGVKGEPGSLGFMQLNCADTRAAETFYTAVFGWGSRRDPLPMDREYVTLLQAGAAVGGIMPMPPGAGAPAHWLTYFAVADVDASHARATELGARTFVPPMDVGGMARMCVLADPQGAAFALVRFAR